MTLLRKPLLFLFSFLTFYTSAQEVDIEITGQVFLHNSMDKYGKIKYARDATIKTLQSRSTSSDRRGQFKLKFKNVDPEEPIFISIKKGGYEVIDERDLQYFYLDKKPKLRVFLAKKGYVRNTRSRLTESALKAHNAEKERLLDLLEFGGVAEKAAFKTIEERTGRKLYTSHDAKEYILQMSKEYLEHLSFYSYELAIINPDFASETYMNAMDAYLQSDPEETVATLQEEELDESVKEIISMINEVKDDPEKVSQVIDSRFRRVNQIKNNYIFQIISLQQNFQFKEASEVIAKLAKINAIAPTHKCSNQIKEMRAFKIYEFNEVLNSEEPIVAKEEKTINEKTKLEAAVLEVITKVDKEEGIQQEIAEVESYSKPIAIEPSTRKDKSSSISGLEMESKNNSITKTDILKNKKQSNIDILSDKGNKENADKMITKVEQVNEGEQKKGIVKKDLTNKSLSNASIDDFENILFFSNISTVELISILQDEQKILTQLEAEAAAKEVIKRDKLIKKTNPIAVEETKPKPIIYTTPKPVVQNKTELLVFSDIPEPSFYSITKKTSLRKSPDPKAKILKRLSIGTEMEFIEKIDKYWYKVRLNGKIGYVKSYRLKKVK